ncbi:unnamed protein product [Effrenium voratum]|nr:unnamed protein product [Effrenium voratum]
MWPVIIDRESLMSFWHVFEYLCNTLIFFLAGALTGSLGGSIVFCSMPLLQLMHPARQKVTVQEALVITWGGLRGAVGLSLAIQVAKDRAGGVLSYEDAHRVLFYVGGVAALTLVVNATTSPLLVSVLGITRWESAKQSMMLMLHSRLKAGLEFSDRKLRKFGSPDPVAQVFESGFPAETGFNSHPRPLWQATKKVTFKWVERKRRKASCPFVNCRRLATKVDKSRVAASTLTLEPFSFAFFRLAGREASCHLEFAKSHSRDTVSRHETKTARVVLVSPTSGCRVLPGVQVEAKHLGTNSQVTHTLSHAPRMG